MLLNLIVFKFVPGILKCLDASWMSFFVFFIFNCKFIYIYIYISKAFIHILINFFSCAIAWLTDTGSVFIYCNIVSHFTGFVLIKLVYYTTYVCNKVASLSTKNEKIIHSNCLIYLHVLLRKLQSLIQE